MPCIHGNSRIAPSLSARRAWIEIHFVDVFAHFFCVALRKESVDRNVDTPFAADRSGWSLSARRAWIEIPVQQPEDTADESLSARRAWIEIVDDALEREVLQSLSARRAWIEIHDGYSNPIYSQVALRKESVDRNDGA